MGLLDDAIREHLELKRLRGADPTEVIRKEREALGPVLGGGEEISLALETADPQEPSVAGEGPAFAGAEAHSEPDISHLSQETVELDMRAVLEAQSIEHADGATPDTSPPAMRAASSRAMVEPPAWGACSTEDSLDWEMPQKRDHSFSGGLREEEPMRRTRITDALELPARDALAGVPESLLDTRSQERLWLDRKSIRDAGFDR